MAEAKKSAKGQKIGRHSRAPSNSQQTTRSAKNKRLNIEANPWSVRGEVSYGHQRPKTLEDAKRPSRLPSVNALNDAKTARLAAQREANAPEANSGFRLEFSDKLAEAVAKHRKVSVQSFKLALKFREKRHAAHS